MPRFKRELVRATQRFVSPTISGTTETPLLEPVGSCLSRASSRNSPARWRSSATRWGSAAITWSAANAAAALAGKADAEDKSGGVEFEVQNQRAGAGNIA